MKINKKILFLILLGILSAPGLVSAQITIQTMIDHVKDLSLYIGSAVVIILWVVTGILFLSAQGAPEKLTSAKKALMYSIVGTVIVIVANFAMDLVGKAVGI